MIDSPLPRMCERCAGGAGPATIGALLTERGEPVMKYAQPGMYNMTNNKGTEPDISNDADFYSMHAICDKKFGILQHETSSPAAMELLTLEQVRDDVRRIHSQSVQEA